MGRRYKACLSHLGEPFKTIDIDTSADEKDQILDKCNKAIIAVPTRAHLDVIEECQFRNITYLCEKPLARYYPSKIKPTGGYIVNNWNFIAHDGLKKISYNFYKTGSDGLLWDICQLITLSCLNLAYLEVQCQSPIWKAHFNDREIQYREIEESYIQMIQAFISDDEKKLWPIEMGLDQIRQVDLVSIDIGVSDVQNITNGTGTLKIDPTTWENFRNYRRETTA